MAGEQRAFGHRDQRPGVAGISMRTVEVLPGQRRVADPVQTVGSVREEVWTGHPPPVSPSLLDGTRMLQCGLERRPTRDAASIRSHSANAA